MKNIPFILKIAVKPFLVLGVIIAVSLFGFSRAFYEIGNLREQMAKATKEGNILKSKLDILSSNSQSVASDAGASAAYLPGENSALQVLSQLRANAQTYGILISNLKVNPGAKDPSGFMKTTISFDVQGDLSQIIDFINTTKISSPNTWIDSTELNFTADTLHATVSISSYWAPFPTKIPALTEPITSLDASEKEILLKISGYERPSFVTLTPEAPRDNPNPFGE